MVVEAEYATSGTVIYKVIMNPYTTTNAPWKSVWHCEETIVTFYTSTTTWVYLQGCISEEESIESNL